VKAFIELTRSTNEKYYLNPLSIESFEQRIGNDYSIIYATNRHYYATETPKEIEKLINDFIKESVMINGV
jgi:hypothetical protein